MSIRAVPQIANPEAVSDSAIRYGYVAYHDIALGNDHQVQPDTSPYHKLIPCRELIPFSDMQVTEIDVKKYGEGGTFNRQNVAPVGQRPKSAKECAAEIEQAYQYWAFVVLTPLTGLSTDRAFNIFQTVQPFPYLLKDMEAGLDDAEARIEATAPYEVAYQGEIVDLLPLPDEDKAVAKAVLSLVKTSAEFAVTEAHRKLDVTIESMNNRFSGGEGKRVPDPHDKYLSKELGLELPKLITNQTAPQQQAPVQQFVQSESPQSIELKQRELDLRERELIAKEIELGIRPRPDTVPVPASPMATAPAARKKCAGTNAADQPCGAYAKPDSDYCASHGE
jgi:hypothetical protein